MRNLVGTCFGKSRSDKKAPTTQQRVRLALEEFEPQLVPSSLPLHVAGNVLQDSNGRAVYLKGVNLPSLEYSYGGDHLTTNAGDSLDVALNRWKANFLRLPLNEDFWFGYVFSSTQNGDKGASYRTIVDNIVNYASARNA